MTLAKENSLLLTFPDIAEEAYGWDPSSVSRGSHKKLAWKCKDCGHIWEAIVLNRTLRGSGCPVCRRKISKPRLVSSLLVSHPDVAAEAYGWDPSEVTAGSGMNKNWKCRDCRNVWEAKISNRVRGQSKCWVCYPTKFRKSIEETHPDVAAEAYGWDPSEVTAGSNIQKLWRHKNCNHTVTKSPKQRIEAPKCMMCQGWVAERRTTVEINGRKGLLVNSDKSLWATHPHIAEELIDTAQGYLIQAGSKVILWWACRECLHEWKATVANRTRNNTGCPNCAKSGFNPSEPAWVYFLPGIRNNVKFLQYGITGHLKNRISFHRKNGFKVDTNAVFLYFPFGIDAAKIEREIRIELIAKGVPSAMMDSFVNDKFSGYRETFRQVLLPVYSLGELLVELDIDLNGIDCEWKNPTTDGTPANHGTPIKDNNRVNLQPNR